MAHRAQELVERKKSPCLGVGCQGDLHGESSLIIALGEEAGFGPAEVCGHHPNTQAWKNSDLRGHQMSSERM